MGKGKNCLWGEGGKDCVCSNSLTAFSNTLNFFYGLISQAYLNRASVTVFIRFSAPKSTRKNSKVFLATHENQNKRPAHHMEVDYLYKKACFRTENTVIKFVYKDSVGSASLTVLGRLMIAKNYQG